MRILAVVQGHYGERKVENIRQHGPKEWQVDVFRLPRVLPPIVDDPEEFLPLSLPQADLILALGEHPGVPQLLPALVKRTGARSVLAPIDNSAWVPPGLKNQIQKELQDLGVGSVFPKPFCSLTEDSHGYGRSAESYNDPLVSEFAHYFGRPKLKIAVNPETKHIEKVEVLRSSACGSTYHVARELVGVPVEKAAYEAGLLCHHYPCLASMAKEWIDDRLEDTLMHVSGYILQEEVEKEIKPYKEPQYFVPGERVEARG